jgi:asparagine synthase (glutamine-hydrolysing)
MFALAIWDDQRKTLLLARDSYGIKPLYYSTDAGVLRLRHRSRDCSPAALCPEAWILARSERSCSGDPSRSRGRSMTRSGSCRPATTLIVECGAAPSTRSFAPCTSEEVVATPLSTALEQSVAAHLVSDVPLAVFLSSGLDSALLAALARRHRPSSTRSPCASPDFAGTHEDEGPLAGMVASFLGTRHHDLEVSREEPARHVAGRARGYGSA